MYTNQWNKNQMFTSVYLFKTCPLGKVLTSCIPRWVVENLFYILVTLCVVYRPPSTEDTLSFITLWSYYLCQVLRELNFKFVISTHEKKIVKSIGERKKIVNSTCEKCLIQKRDLHRILLLNRYVKVDYAWFMSFGQAVEFWNVCFLFCVLLDWN